MGKLFNYDLNSIWEYENGYHLTSPVTRISKSIAHYELYKKITNLPGHVLEFGVYKAASLIRFATYREMLENPFSRKIVGFDAFGKFPEQERNNDKAFIKDFENAGGNGISKQELEKVFKFKGFNNFELVEGDITETLPEYIGSHPELKIALLHIDVDVYKPTQVILNNLFNHVVKGGIIIFDDYGIVDGETKAIDEFFVDRKEQIQKLPIAHLPSYIIKL